MRYGNEAWKRGMQVGYASRIRKCSTQVKTQERYVSGMSKYQLVTQIRYVIIVNK